MKLGKFFLCAGIVLFVSCFSFIPPVSEAGGKAVLLVKSDVPVRDSSSIVGALHFYYSENEYFSVTPNARFLFIGNLKPGSYTVFKVGLYNTSSNSYAAFFNIKIEFEMREKCITVLPAKLTAEETGGGYQNYGLRRLDADDFEKTKKYLKTNKNAYGWGLIIGLDPAGILMD